MRRRQASAASCPNEVLLNISATTSVPTLDAIARRHRLTRLEMQDFTLTRRRIARLRINDSRPVATVIRSLQADLGIVGAQPNYLFASSRTARPRLRQAIHRNTHSPSCGCRKPMNS